MDYKEKYNAALERAKDRMGFGWASGPFSREEYIDWLKSLRPQKQWKPTEKQGEQPTDKVEPKFKVGDWITNGGANPCYVKSIFGDYYELCSCEGFKYTKHIIDVNYTYRLWSINDAKDGDVLAINWNEYDDSFGKIIIFKKYHNKGVKGLYSMPCVEGYGNTFKNGKLAFQEEIPYYSETWTDNLHPATKEQRDLLFEKMKEAGHEWDNEKKELKKIEHKFNVDEWIVTEDSFGKIVRHIDEINYNLNNKRYVASDENGLTYNISFSNENKWHKWTIADAKDGDVLHSIGIHGDCIFIFNGLDKWKFDEPNVDRAVATGYCCLILSANNMEFGIQGPDCIEVDTVKPATKEQRELLFVKMKQKGYEWDTENKKLSKQTLKITPKFCAGQLITDNNGNWYKITNIKCLDDWYYELYDIVEDNTHLELCSIIDENFRENRFVDEIKKMIGD